MASQKTVLLIEDDRDISSTICGVLESAGYRAIGASNGVEGQKLVAGETPDLVITDSEMPIMNGFDFCTEFRKLPDGASVPFIFLTSFDSKERQKKARSVGADDFLIKPFDMDELLEMVKTRLNRIIQIKKSAIKEKEDESQ